MALTVAAPSLVTVLGNQRVTITQVTFDNSYVTDGLAITAADVGLNFINAMVPFASSGYNVTLIGGKLVVYDHILGVEVVGTTDLATLTADLLCFGS